MSLQPPPPQAHPTREALKNALKTWTQSRSYAITTKQSSAKKGVVYYQCDHGGTYRNTHKLTDDDRQRSTARQVNSCPFSAVAKCKGGQWEFSVQNDEHNHVPLRSPHAHLSLLSLDQEQQGRVEAMSAAGAKPRNITITLHRNRSNDAERPVTVKDVYNTRQKICVKNLAGRTPI
jgi:hypothetical protein